MNWRGLVTTMLGSVRMQARITSQNIEDLRPLLTMPLTALVSVAVLVHSGKAELAGYGLVAAVLMTIGQMGNFVASEIVFQERSEQTLELVVASPAPYYFVLLSRIIVLTALGMIGAIESWLVVRICFGLELTVHHGWLAVATLACTSLAAAGTALCTTALFALGAQVRTFQNAINGPLYLLGGVLVPTQYLPGPLQLASPLVFFYWSANLLRAALVQGEPIAVGRSLSNILALGVCAAVLGYVVLQRMLDRLRRTGAVGLT
jgi:ABC-2 type transport system permease protein